MAHHVAEQLLRIALQRFEFGIRFTDDVRFHLHAGPQKGAQADQLKYLDALEAFQKNHYIAVRHFYGLVHLG